AIFGLLATTLAVLHWGPASEAKSEAAVREPAASKVPQLMLLNRTGKVLGSVGAPADYSNPALSPDGRYLAVSIRDATRKRDIWVIDLLKGVQQRITSDPADDTTPVWSPDGSEIAYCSDRRGHRDLFVRTVAEGPERLLFSSDQNKNPIDWASNGSAI